mmetsp:Transcript_38725/g.71297  ORF Transcript_38725/g.71297 Transcript_38725/m.71297 type:complete len:101 (-) Transcript_38725:401-703(-)
MYRLTRSAPNRANGINLLRRLSLTLVAFSTGRFVDNGDLAKIASRTCLDEGNGSGEAEAIDASAGRDVVKRVKNEGEFLDVWDVEFRVVANVAVVREVLR